MDRRLEFVTLSGVPLRVSELKWPFHPSTSGSDWFVLHGRVELLGSSEGLHADVAVGMTQTMKDALGSLEAGQVEGTVINSIRKTIDNGQVAFLQSGKLQPVHVTSRFYSFAAKRVQFPSQSDHDVMELLKRRVFWLSGKQKGQPVAIADPYDCQYVNAPREKMLAIAKELASQGLVQLDGEHATATDALLSQSTAIEQAMHKGVEAGTAATKVTA